MTHHSFLSEFSNMIDNQLYSAGQLIILGDFYYHLDCINNSLATQLKSLGLLYEWFIYWSIYIC